MAQSFSFPFSRAEVVELWSRIVAGWANSLDTNGIRTLMGGLPLEHDAGGSYEGVTRMLPGLSGWLSYPNRPAQLEWRGVTYDLEALMRRALVNGCDPDEPRSWRHPPVRNKDGDQRTVESGMLAFSLWQSRDRVWSRMSEREQGNVFGFLDQVGQHPSFWDSNWAFFWLLNHTARKGLNLPYDQTILNEVTGEYLDGAYCGDGWYDDAEKRGAQHFDGYITWVFGMYLLAWSEMDGHSVPERRDELLERVRAWMRHFPYFFAADGSTVEYGRSIASKFARMSTPLWAYKLGAWPHSVGMLKRLVSRNLRWYLNRGALRADGTLIQQITGAGSIGVIEGYVSTGTSYGSMTVFNGLWSLPDDDPFWSAEEEPLPIEQGDFRKVFSVPGWVLSGHDGHVQQFNAGSGYANAGSKYMKLVYSSRNPFNVGVDGLDITLDSSLCLNENGLRGQREAILGFAVGDSGWLRTRYVIPINGHQHIVDTTLIPLGDIHLRAHRITLDPAAAQVIAEEGSAAIGYNSYDIGTHPIVRGEDGWEFVEMAGGAVGIKPLQGYSATPQVISGSPNIVYLHNHLIVLTTAPLNQQHTLICAVYSGAADNTVNLPKIEQAGWEADGQFVALVNGETISVPAL